METSLLTTKLNIPPLKLGLVSRIRLLDRLKQGFKYGLILVSAPAGFGKTTLLSEWACQERIRAAWVSLDEDDNDPVRFWKYFIGALQTLHPSCGEKALAFLHSVQAFNQAPPIESVLTLLINDLTSVTGDFIIVLDDYHLIESKQVNDGVTFLLDHLPARMHLAMATRADPLLPLAHFRGKGTMLEISTGDLRFTPEDATLLLKEMNEPGLSADDIAALNERTEGWVVGLKMAALSMRGRQDIPKFIAAFTGSQRYVMDYLLEEVLHQQTMEMRDFLLKTSVLERLCSPLCDAITGGKGSQDILFNLDHGHLFIVPLDDERYWYRYEHLFADLLRHQLKDQYNMEDINHLHDKAMKWYEKNGLSDDAIHHALVARDWENSARLLSEHGRGKSAGGEFVTLFSWLQRLPEEVIFSHPELRKLYIFAMQMTGPIDAAETYLKNLEKRAQGDDSLMGEIAVSQAGIAWRRHDYPLAGKLARKALSLLPPDELEDRSLMSVTQGWVYFLSGNLKKAEPMFTESYEFLRQSGNYYLAFTTFGSLVSIVWLKGQLRRTLEMCEQAIELSGPPPASGVPHIALGSLYYEWNDLRASADHIQRVIELGQLIGTMQLRVQINDILARIRLAQGDEIGFLKALEKADFEARTIGEKTSTRAEHAAYHIEFALRQDDLADALEWGNKLDENSGALPWEKSWVPVRLLIAQGYKNDAMEQLPVLYEKAAQSGAQRLMIIYRVCQTLAAETDESALEFLADALTMAEPEGYVRTFVDEGRLLVPLLDKAVRSGIKPEYAGRLLRIIEEEQHQKAAGREKTRPGGPYEVLSEREKEVLRFLAGGFTNRQIAERLFISIGTVKTHVHNVMAKLDADSRIQVVVRARELNLL